MDKKSRAREVNKILEKHYGQPKIPLNHETVFQLLVAVILSAQCTDARVNKVTPALFNAFPTPKKMANAKLEELEALIKSTGFYKNKAKNIKGCASIIINDFNGNVPKSMDQMLTLPGVGRKTANVILGDFYKKPQGIVVDTHVGRLAVRLGLTTTKNTKDAIKIEKDLIKLLPKKDWANFSLYLVFHGRSDCTARKAFCNKCKLNHICPSAKNIKQYVNPYQET